MKVSGSANPDHNGTFVVTGVDVGLGNSKVAVAPVRSCPECGRRYGGLHPRDGCRHGAVERIMES